MKSHSQELIRINHDLKYSLDEFRDTMLNTEEDRYVGIYIRSSLVLLQDYHNSNLAKDIPKASEVKFYLNFETKAIFLSHISTKHS